MRLLLDTHALLWWRDDDRTLGSSARALIADPANDVSISVVSLWEIVTKCRAGKLPVGLSELYQVDLSLTHAPSRPKVRLGEERKQFFFEKKNQKTFDY